MISEKLYNEAITCPIAMTELVKQYMCLSEQDKAAWIESLGYDKINRLGQVMLSMANGLESIILYLTGVDDNGMIALYNALVKKFEQSTIRVSQSPSPKGLSASRDWLRDQANQYRGQWVAVCEGRLLGVAESPKALLLILGSDYDRSNTIITEVV